eukprot:scaffold1271_cov47-Phaeocystis_antarctica.AAC.2
MKTSRPVDARLWAAREDPGLQSELGAEYTRLTGGCHEHAARFDRTCTIGEGPGRLRAYAGYYTGRFVVGRGRLRSRGP